MKTRLSFIFLLLHLSIFAQLETSNWLFGQFLGIKFNSSELTLIVDGQLDTREGCATISDSLGNLLFYTDGTTVYNRHHQIMRYGSGLAGNSSSTQSAIIIPYPEDPEKYIIFTVGADDRATPISTTNQGFNFYYVDMRLDNGNGAVLYPQLNLLLPLSSEKIAAVKHINGKDYWVVTHFRDKFYSYLVTREGVNRNPIISTIGPEIDPRTYPVNARGYLRISPNGKKIAIAHLSNLNYDDIPFDALPPIDIYNPTNNLYANAYPGYLGLYNFNKATGIVSNEIVLDTTGSPYGIEFSPDNNLLYATIDYHTIDENNYASWRNGELVQYNLSLNPNQIAGSKRIIRNYVYQDTGNEIFTARGALQMALNQKIYLSRDEKYYISHLQDPNNLQNPGFEEVGFRFSNATRWVHTTYGLPPFISSSFTRYIEIIDSDFYEVCLNQSFQLSFTNPDEVTVVSYLWDFGNGNTSTLATPSYSYNQAGVYTVRLTINTTEYGMFTYDIQITVLDDLVINPAVLEGCDDDLDGIVSFDLNLAQPQLSASTDLRYLYFLTQEDAQLNQNSIAAVYQSTEVVTTLFVRAENRVGCWGISTIELRRFQPQTLVLDSIFIFVPDNEVTINFLDYSQNIEDAFNGLLVNTVTFYATRTDLEQNISPIMSAILTINQPITVFAKVNLLNEVCEAVVELTFYPTFIPYYIIDDVIKCSEDSVLIEAPEGYSNYQWVGVFGEDLNQDLTSRTINIKNEGQYSVTFFNEHGHQRTAEFSVSNYSAITVTDVFVDQNNSIVIQAIGEGLSYSIDGVNWFSENVIVDLDTGIYTVYIRNMYGCQITVNEIYIFKWTNFLSPNMDNVNRYWEVNGLEKYNNVEVKIFNRFGILLVDKVMNYERVIWDGKHNGKIQPSDSYWYIIKIPGYVKYSGFVLLKNKI